jgi:ribokinase
MKSNSHIVVIGSINMDLVCRTPRMPVGGETILGSDFVTIPGGKGANQSVAAARLAGRKLRVHHIGRVGDDDFGRRLLKGLRENNVETKHIAVTPGISSGVAMIIVEKSGENRIVVAPGANAKVTPVDLDRAGDLIASAAAVVLQLEIPQTTVLHGIAMCQRQGVFTILDPAPVPDKGLPRAIFGVDLLTPNESESRLLLGECRQGRSGRTKPVDAKQIAADLLARGCGSVVLKLGSRGSLRLDRNGKIDLGKPFKVKAIDTTAAGDAFTGALAVAHAEGMKFSDSLRFANAAGAICCSRFGAQPALPWRDEVSRLMQSQLR